MYVLTDSVNLEESNASKNSTDQSLLRKRSSLSSPEIYHKTKKKRSSKLGLFIAFNQHITSKTLLSLKEIQKLMDMNSCTCRTNHPAY